MIIANNIEDIKEAVYNANEDTYLDRMKSVCNNFKAFKDYAVTEDWMYDRVYKNYDQTC